MLCYGVPWLSRVGACVCVCGTSFTAGDRLGGFAEEELHCCSPATCRHSSITVHTCTGPLCLSVLQSHSGFHIRAL